MADQTAKSLSEELQEHLKKGSKPLKTKPKIEDASDEEIEEASKKITKKDISEEKKNIGAKKETLIPLEEYIKCAVHLGTKVITPHMRRYVYKRRADGLSVINTTLIDDKIREAIDFLKNYEPEDIYVCCKREVGWPAAEKFNEVTGIRIFTKKYPPGITTNLRLEEFFEAKMTIICDPWIDKNALQDTIRLKKPVLSLCDTNNYTKGITQLIPCNNKSRKSIGCILYLLAREYNKAKGIKFDAKLEDFAGPLE
jgi:small subunit ribosomal protein S2